MTYKELTDYIFRRMQYGGHMMSEQVPSAVADMILGTDKHIDALEYLENKCSIGGDASGQKNT